jgi:hypothetical protein
MKEGARCSRIGPYSDARTCCAFCRKLLPVNEGQVLAWRSANGLFFCTEFCADDAEEALCQSRGRSDRQVQPSIAPL